MGNVQLKLPSELKELVAIRFHWINGNARFVVLNTTYESVLPTGPPTPLNVTLALFIWSPAKRTELGAETGVAKAVTASGGVPLKENGTP